jgi:membrane-associated protease RseP (regulator of RpoE activity)
VDLIGFLGVVVFFNFVVGVMNLLPMFPLDGGMMFGVLLGTWIGKKRGFAWARWLAIYVLFLLAVNIFPLFFPNS